jgi:hypothetical protein
MIPNQEIEKRLNAAIDRWAPGSDQERIARNTAKILVPEVKKLLAEQSARERAIRWPNTT